MIMDAARAGVAYLHQLKPSWAVVGQTYITARATHVKQQFTYINGQSSSLGVGISVSGKLGTFTADGTVARSATVTEVFPTYGTGTKAWYRTRFRVAKYEKFCASDPQATRYFVRANGYAGGESILHPRTAPIAHRCEPQPKGCMFIAVNETAVTWSAGFAIAVVGFSGSTQTGYDHSAQVVYTYLANRQVCGTRGMQPAQAKQVVAER